MTKKKKPKVSARRNSKAKATGQKVKPKKQASQKPKSLERRALLIEQNDQHPLYIFALSASEILDVADVSRISRNSAGELIGYQRSEVKKHIGEITDYVNGENALFPNAIILALSSNVKFTKSRGPGNSDGLSVAGKLSIPLPQSSQKKPAWIVDGQQRTIALSESERHDFPVPVAAFVADDIEVQREQFLLINNTRPLPRGLVDELLPEVSAPLPSKMAARRIPSELCGALNQSERSPFFEMIKRSSSTPAQRKAACITDASISKMIQESLNSPSGCLFPYRNIATGETDFEGIWAILNTYWGTVKELFPDAWGKPPSKSRLMHGVGIRAMGRLMDKVMSSIDPMGQDAPQKVLEELELIAPVCRWTRGSWEELNSIPWNGLQNTNRDIKVLSNYLIRTYVQKKMFLQC